MGLFRVKSTWLFPLLVVLLGACYVFLFHTYEGKFKANNTPQVQKSDEAYPVTGPLTVEVHLQRNFLDGERSVDVIYETIWSMEDFWSSYEDWQLVDQNLERVIFEQKVDDISPLSKVNGYFGLTEDGILTIFNGSPVQSEIIQSFYQVDVKKLESSLIQKLEQGIPVRSKQNYKAVLNQYKPYAIN
ncbi:BofC C-terminal domain-containing protein [Alkalihalobacillus sp. AL-G]|uniref:BofC C-terminal domain-containing protein n=1 Tax=Alkalihalobacillus sp. AL-G TaxID=2926399 RepID=UPI00272BBB1C|nr:BofC C-terminal domain-containing protein [Alkalihalobacillus sp. AL-G]WLD92223.1 intercompartmental signaling factor BofC [Alkalihalobacillus sp. AL-G]